MAELDTVSLTNPTKEDFTFNFNGEAYTVKTGETKSFGKFAGYHLAKHLSTHMIVEDAMSKATKKDMDDPRAIVHSKVAQLNVYDTPERRIALYTILKNTNEVIEVVRSYPFKGFVGDMKMYEDFVAKMEKKSPEEDISANQ